MDALFRRCSGLACQFHLRYARYGKLHPLQHKVRADWFLGNHSVCAIGTFIPNALLYTCSDAGIGGVVGPEMFNLLIIVGCASLADSPILIVFEIAPSM